jgi:putative ABC transport system permease protein
MSDMVHDLRLTARALLLHSPGFTAAGVLSLALGIGASAAIFSVVHALELKPLPYRDSARLVLLQSQNPELKVEKGGLALGDFRDLRQRSKTLEGLSAHVSTIFDWTGTDRPEVLDVTLCSPSLFPLLGVRAALGRTFLPEEEMMGRDQVALLSDGFWRDRFGASRGVLGKTLALGGKSYQIVGVLPPGFAYPLETTKVWTPIAFPPGDADRKSHYFKVIGRLREGVTLEQAHREVATLTRTFAAEHPDTNRGWSAKPVSLLDTVVGEFRPVLVALSIAVGLLLLITGTNVANLLLARGLSRSKETAVRAALGAGRSRLVTLFLLESLLLALSGGLLGLLFARWGVSLLVAFHPASLPRIDEIAVDGTVVVFCLLLSVVAGLAFGAIPAVQLSRPNLNVSSRTIDSLPRSRLRSALVVSEVALSLVLLVAGALTLQSFLRLSRVQPGFDAEGVVALQIFLAPDRYRSQIAEVQFFDHLLAEVKGLPGVRAAGAASGVPLNPEGQNLMPFEIEGEEHPEAEGVYASFASITPGYFQTLGIPLRAGRVFTDRDDAAAPGVAVINDEMARRFWPGESPIGKRLKMSLRSDKDSYEVIGVVGSTRHNSLLEKPEPEIYAPLSQVPNFGMVVVARTEGDPWSLAELIQRRVYQSDRDQPVFRTFLMEDLVRESGKQTRFYMVLFAVFAVVGLSLATIGLYGVVAYSVSRRLHEISVRIAVGAKHGDVLRLVVKEGLKLGLLGVAIGVLVAFGVVRFLSSLLYDIGAHDSLTFTIVPLIVIATAVLASCLPAQRALRVDPVEALRAG